MEAACWAHVRRKFFDVHAATGSTGSPIAKETLDHIGALYKIEADIRGKPPDERLQWRQEHAMPLIAGLKIWLEITLPKLSGKSDLASAMRYALGRWGALGRFLHDGRKTTLGQLIEAGIQRPIYTYDFGDDWRHVNLVESVAAAETATGYPRFIAGANRAPPEDVGGQPGFEHFLNVMADPAHSEHADITQWYGSTFNPKDIAETEITLRVAKLAKRRTITKTAPAKSKRQIK